MRLSANLDLTSASVLWSDLHARRGQAVTLDASDVERLGAACLQILIAAAAHWRRDGVDFRIAAPSSAFLDGLRVMGAAGAFTLVETA